jgi:hypothetical protein
MKTNNGFLLLLFRGFFSFMGLGFLVLSVFTLIPSHASKLNRLGYSSICSYSPISTILLLVLSAVSLRIVYQKSGQMP